MRHLYFFWVLAGCLLHAGKIYALSPLQTQLRTAGHDSTRLRLYSELANYYHDQNKHDSLELILNSAFELAKKLNTNHFHSKLYLYRGDLLQYRKQFDEAVKMYQLAIAFGKKNRQYEYAEFAGFYLATTYTDKAYHQGKKNAQVACIRQLFENIKFAEQHRSFRCIIHNYSLLSMIYGDNGKDSLSHLYKEKQLPFLKKSKKTRERLFYLFNTIEINLYRKQTQAAETYLNRAFS